MKLHRHLSELMLRTRSTLGLMRPLFQVTEDEKIEYRIMEELAALRRKVPSRSAARHMYCRDLLNLAAAQQQAGRRVSKGIGKRIVAKHGIMWQELDDQRKEMYEKQAVEYSDAKRQGIVDDIGTTRAGLIEHRKQAVERKTLDAPVRVSHCRFSEGEILEFNTLWESARFSNTSVLELQIAACVPVQPPDPAVLDILDAFPGKLKELVPRRLAIGSCSAQGVLPQHVLAGEGQSRRTIFEVHLRQPKSVMGHLLGRAARRYGLVGRSRCWGLERCRCLRLAAYVSLSLWQLRPLGQRRL
jgi:hypothetical protein